MVWEFTGEARFLGGVASVKGVEGFDPDAAKKRFFEIYLDKVIFMFLDYKINLLMFLKDNVINIRALLCFILRNFLFSTDYSMRSQNLGLDFQEHSSLLLR